MFLKELNGLDTDSDSLSKAVYVAGWKCLETPNSEDTNTNTRTHRGTETATERERWRHDRGTLRHMLGTHAQSESYVLLLLFWFYTYTYTSIDVCKLIGDGS